MARNNASFTRQVAFTKTVTPSNTVDLPDGVTYGFIINGGDIAVVFADGSEDTLSGLAVGVVHPIRVKRVKATGTTATLIKACY